MGPIKTVRQNCRKCYSCVRICPVKAIKVKKDSAEIIHHRCIGCGECLRVCSQKAKVIADAIQHTRDFIAEDRDVIAVLGTSYPAFFSEVRPGQLANGMRRLGFSEVHQGAFGVELIRSSIDKHLQAGEIAPLISSHCPTIVDLIERHYPQLVKNLMPVVSPMVAIGRYIREQRGDVRVVYISSCIAGKFEIESEEVAGSIDLVLTFKELSQMLKDEGIDLTRLPDSHFDGRAPRKGGLFAISVGPLKAFEIEGDALNTEHISTEGKENALEVIKDLAAARIKPRIVDLRFCNGGCIGGPGKNNRLTSFSKRNLIVDYHKRNDVPYRESLDYAASTLGEAQLERSFKNKYRRLELPSGDSINKILQSTNKFSEKDELDCGACGYNTCREHAVAVFQGLAEQEICLPWSLKRLEDDQVVLAQKYELAQRALAQEFGDTSMVGTDPRTIEVLKLIHQVGPTPTTVLLRGESGTGKELTARAIHEASQRSDKPLVTVNCTTLTDSLLESELFGHKKGSFTGAIADKRGLFEAANGGTIFLDEIGDITPKLQAELLRVLDSGEIRPVGGNSSSKVDVRLIAATNRNLEDGVKQGWFREDLYYRLNVFTITVPPLRNRLESIPALTQHFIRRASQRTNKSITGIEDRAISAMMQYNWPGNIREMQNVIERAAVLAQDDIIRLENLPVIFAELALQGGSRKALPNSPDFRSQRDRHLSQVEKGLIQHYLDDAGGNVSLAARKAQIPRRTFYRLLERYDLKGTDYRRKNR